MVARVVEFKIVNYDSLHCRTGNCVLISSKSSVEALINLVKINDL